MAKKGRPNISIDYETFEKLCEKKYTQVMIAEFFDISIPTLKRHIKKHYGKNFAQIINKKGFC